MFSVPHILLVAAIAGNGLMAGLFWAFTVAVAPAFRRLDDRGYVDAFRAINSAILNGWFLSAFMLTPLVGIAAAVFAGERTPLAFGFLAAGAVSAAATFVITAAANVPLNNGLERASITTEQDRATARARFESSWNRWNLVRTITSIVALLSFGVAALGA